MKPFNVEIFSPNFEYVDSCQMSIFSQKDDCLNIETNEIELLNVSANTGDYIRITTNTGEICGIITKVAPEDDKTIISYESFVSLFDLNVFFDRSLLSSNTLENCLSAVITSNFVSNSDALQNIYGLIVFVRSSTPGALLDLDSNISNLYELFRTAFLNYGVVVKFAMLPQKKQITCTISKNINKKIVIEAELPNVISKSFVIKKANETINKLVVINEANESEIATYYKNTNDEVTTVDAYRISPVVPDTVYISVTDTEVFIDKAYDKAFNVLTSTKLDNLVKIQFLNDDSLVSPLMLSIGQEVDIIYQKMIYNSILTGFINTQKDTTLIFGAIRLELSKKIKRR